LVNKPSFLSFSRKFVEEGRWDEIGEPKFNIDGVALVGSDASAIIGEAESLLVVFGHEALELFPR
jgi:hypothetical protein